jgi:hypothetical protein
MCVDKMLSYIRDFVDTEPSTGNVLKMLLGAINALFDDDYDDQDDIDAGAEQVGSPRSTTTSPTPYVLGGG